MTQNINYYKELLPEYINHQLDEDVRADLEKHIQADDALKKELEELTQLKKSYAGLTEHMPNPSPGAFLRIMENIERMETSSRSEQRSDSSVIKGFRRWVETLRDRLAVPKTAWAVAAVQMAVIVVMAVVLFYSPADQSYQTLSTGSSISAPVIHVNVVFEGTAMEKDIRNLLTGIHAGIVAGPGQTGLYVIAIHEDQEIDQVMIQLKNADIVKFVQEKI